MTFEEVLKSGFDGREISGEEARALDDAFDVMMEELNRKGETDGSQKQCSEKTGK